MGFNVINFVDGYALGAEECGNLKPLKVTKNGIYTPADYKCNGFSRVDVDVLTKATQIDMLPTWGEIIFDNSWSIKIKKSDENDDADTYSFSVRGDQYGDDVFLKDYTKTWRIYFCIYKDEEFLFADSTDSFTSQILTWAWNWENDIDNIKTWLNVYSGHMLKKIESISVDKLTVQQGTSGVLIYINFPVEWFSYNYNSNGEIEHEVHQGLGINTISKMVDVSVGNVRSFNYFAKEDYKLRAEDMIAYSKAVAKSETFECKIYDIETGGEA